MRLYGKRRACSNHGDLLPALCLLFGAVLWGLVWYPMRVLRDHGLQGLWLTFLLYAGSLVASLPLIIRVPWPVRARYPLLGVLALLAGWTNIAFILAILHGNVVRVMLLFYLSPAWTLLLARVFLHERITARAFFTIVASVIGAVVLLWQPHAGSVRFSRPDWYAVSAGAAFAASNVLTRRLTDVSLGVKSFCVWSGVVVLAAVLLLAGHVPVPHPGAATLGGAVLLGAVGLLGMTYLIQFGVTHLPAQRSSVIMLTELLAGALSQHWLTAERLTPVAWVGGGVVAIAAYVAARVP